MKHKKLVYSFLGVATALILFLPVLNISFLLLYNNKQTDLWHLTKRELFSTDNLEALINYSAYRLFHVSLNPQQVIAGKECFFFLGNGFASVIDKTRGSIPYTDHQIDSWADRMKKLQEWYEKQGIEFVIVVASNKHTVYSDKLPDDIVYKEGETITDILVKKSLEKGVHMLNLKDALREKKDDSQLYFYTDTHWNFCGAMVGYLHTMQYVNETYNIHYSIPDYSVKETISDRRGDLTNFLKINQFLSTSQEKNCQYTFKEKNVVCYGKIGEDYRLHTCKPSDQNKFNQYFINMNAPNKAKLLYLSDSFGLANTPMYVKTFATVWRLHLGYINKEALSKFVHKHKPEIVIYQVVERDLISMTNLADMP